MSRSSESDIAMLSLFLILISASIYVVSPFGIGVSISAGCNRRFAGATHSNKLFSAASTSLPEGISKKVLKEGTGPAVLVGDVATVRYSCYLPSTEERASSQKPFAKSEEQKVIVGEGIMIDGWELAIQTMKGGERSVVRITDPRYGYGSTGVPPIIPPNAEIQMDVEVLSVEVGVDLGTVASEDPLKPRTPTSIARAYATRRELKFLEEASSENKEGIEAFISKLNSFYFFGFFEGETGQVAPWYLRPSITFPLAFFILGVAFYISFSQGAIKERGIPVTDELDEIIVLEAVVSFMVMFFA